MTMMTTAFDSIPVVSLHGAHAGRDDHGGQTTRELAEQLATICHEVGFFLVTDHGIAADVVDDVFDLMARFFALPDDDRALIDKMASPHFRGWEAVGSEYTNNRVDVREQIDVWSEYEPRADRPSGRHGADAAFWRLLGPNQWMSDDVLPGHRAITLRWMDELGRLADRILSLLALGLDLAPDVFTRMFGDQPMSLTKMIHYPPTPAGGAGVNAHHDAGFLTLLAPGPTPGLQVLNPAGDWIDVPSVPGAFVVNLGEMLQGMTGNYFVATPHRVITATERFSAAYFQGPSLDTPLEPLHLDRRFVDAVANSERHRGAGYMASANETDAGVGDMASTTRAATYGEQLWNYFSRSYPANVAAHHSDLALR